MTIELVGGAVGALLTILILSYLIFGDNFLYRLALHILVGASVGYAAAVATVTVLIPAVFSLYQGNAVELVLPVVLGLLLLFKAFPRLASLGNFSTAFLVGTGAAVAVGGALLGTILPQATASGSLSNWQQPAHGLLVAVGTALALLAFTFTIRRREGLRGIRAILMGFVTGLGRAFLVAAFGAIFAAALIASFSVFIGRIHALREGLEGLLQLIGG